MTMLRVTVAYAAPGVEALVDIELEAPACVADAIERSRIVEAYGLDLAAIVPAIFGQRVDATTPLADGDRVELTRGLIVDPKRARVLRARAKTMGTGTRRLRRS